MFELPSAIFSIADGNEFRFARFYIVCEAVPLGAPESPLLSAACRTHLRGVSKRGQDTEETGKNGREEILAFCSNEYPMHCFYLELYCILHFIVTAIYSPPCVRASFCASFEKFKVWEIDKRTSHDKINVGMQKICKESVNKGTYEDKIIF